QGEDRDESSHWISYRTDAWESATVRLAVPVVVLLCYHIRRDGWKCSREPGARTGAAHVPESAPYTAGRTTTGEATHAARAYVPGKLREELQRAPPGCGLVPVDRRLGAQHSRVAERRGWREGRLHGEVRQEILCGARAVRSSRHRAAES